MSPKHIKTNWLSRNKILFYLFSIGGIGGACIPQKLIKEPTKIIAGEPEQQKETPISSIPKSTERTITTRFSPQGGCTKLIVKAIEEAKEEIYMTAYSFTSENIANALLAAKKKGIKVNLIIDHGEYNRGKAPQVDRLKGKIDYLLIDQRSGYAHNKVIVIDRKSIVTGSFNFDVNAEKLNRENIVLIRQDPVLAQKYINDWLENQRKIIKHHNKKH